MRSAGPSRPVPLLIHTAGVLASGEPLGLRRREAIVMKKRPRASTNGRLAYSFLPGAKDPVEVDEADIVAGH